MSGASILPPLPDLGKKVLIAGGVPHCFSSHIFPQIAMLLSAKRWRLKLKNYLHRNYNYVGAFDGWIVLLDTSASTTDTLRRVLEAGGAKVFTKDQKSPDDCLEKVSIGQGNHFAVELMQ